MKKRIIVLLLAGIMAGTVFACGEDTTTNTTTDVKVTEEAEPTPEETEPTPEEVEPTPEEAEPTPEEKEPAQKEEKSIPEEAESTPEEVEPTLEEPEEEQPEKNQEIAANNKCFMGGAAFTNMQNLVTKNYEDGTYDYRDLTEDGLTTIVNRCIVNDIQTGEMEDYSLYIERLIKENVQPGARDINIMGAGEQESIKGDLPTYYATWTSGENEDTRMGDGVFAIDENYTYMYYFEIGIDGYEEMAEVFLDVMDRVELVEMMK